MPELQNQQSQQGGNGQQEDQGGNGPSGQQGTGQKASYTPPSSQEELDRIISDRLARERAKFGDYDDLKSKAGELDLLKQANQSDLEKANSKAEQAEQKARQAEEKAQQAEQKALRAEVAADKKVPANLLSGSTREELEAAADALLEFRGEQPASRKQDPGQGPRHKSKAEPWDEGKERAQKRFGKKSD